MLIIVTVIVIVIYYKSDNYEEVRQEWEKIKFAYEILSNQQLRVRYERNTAVSDPSAVMSRAALDLFGWGLGNVGKGFMEVGKGVVKLSQKSESSLQTTTTTTTTMVKDATITETAKKQKKNTMMKDMQNQFQKINLWNGNGNLNEKNMTNMDKDEKSIETNMIENYDDFKINDSIPTLRNEEETIRKKYYDANDKISELYGSGALPKRNTLGIFKYTRVDV